MTACPRAWSTPSMYLSRPCSPCSTKDTSGMRHASTTPAGRGRCRQVHWPRDRPCHGTPPQRVHPRCAHTPRTGGHGGLHGDEAGLAAHELDHADALKSGRRLHLGRQQRALRLLHRRVEAEALVDLRPPPDLMVSARITTEAEKYGRVLHGGMLVCGPGHIGARDPMRSTLQCPASQKGTPNTCRACPALDAHSLSASFVIVASSKSHYCVVQPARLLYGTLNRMPGLSARQARQAWLRHDRAQGAGARQQDVVVDGLWDAHDRADDAGPRAL